VRDATELITRGRSVEHEVDLVILYVPLSLRAMKTVEHFSSFEDLKASSERTQITPKTKTRHDAIKKLLALLRSKVVRKRHSTGR